MTVYLVGAGPGDPELLTIKAHRLLRRADVLIHDRLADPRLYELVPEHCIRVDVGKRPGLPMQQDAINKLLVLYGRSVAANNGIVVRLKGGDPYVFGRGGEEVIALKEHRIAFDVVPGISSCVAAPAAAGIPITHRGVSASFTVVTGHRRVGDEQQTNWYALAQVGGTIVVLMGVEARRDIATQLIAGGLDPSTPVAAIYRGTLEEQSVRRVRLDQLGDANICAPTTLVIGAVAAMDLSSLALSSLTLSSLTLPDMSDTSDVSDMELSG
jgi:uroporphyrin-III C-methyltransferase